MTALKTIGSLSSKLKAFCTYRLAASKGFFAVNDATKAYFIRTDSLKGEQVEIVDLAPVFLLQMEKIS